MRIHTLPTTTTVARWPIFLLVTLVICYLITAIIPPFQAPDEFDHLKRAYMFGHGQLVLHAPEDGSASGGYVDDGLIDYMNRFVPLAGQATRKVSTDELVNAGQVAWKGTSTFQSPTGTAYYFPVLYLPQAVGLVAGENLGLTVSQSYRLARLLTLLATFAMLYLAFRIYPPSPLLLAVLALPMNVFLLASPTLDCMTTASAAVVLTAFMRIATERHATPRWIINTFFIGLFLLVTCRANTAPFLLLPFATWWLIRDRRHLIGAITVAVLTVGWTLYTMKATVYPAGPRHIDHTARLLSYAIHPDRFIAILYNTLANPDVRGYYIQSFLGNLGWLDTPLQLSDYRIIEVLAAIALVFSLSRDAIAEQRLARILLVLCAIGTILMTYLAMLVQWTIGDSDIIQGVQGRYFTIPVIAIALAIAGDFRPSNGIPRKIALSAVAALLAFGGYTMAKVLVQRYYTAAEQASATILPAALKPSPSLTPDRPVPVIFNPIQGRDPAQIDRLDIMFGTYMHVHPGKAELKLSTNGGDTLSIPFDLAPLVDNGYKSFKLDGKRYTNATIVSAGGEGVSVWESHRGDEPGLSCIVMYTHDGRHDIVSGCPQP